MLQMEKEANNNTIRKYTSWFAWSEDEQYLKRMLRERDVSRTHTSILYIILFVKVAGWARLEHLSCVGVIPIQKNSQKGHNFVCVQRLSVWIV